MEVPNGNSRNSLIRGNDDLSDMAHQAGDGRSLRVSVHTILDVDIFLSNGFDIDFEKFNSLGLSDKQRQNALKLAEKKRNLHSLRLQLSHTGDPSARNDLDDSEIPSRVNSQDPSKLLKRIELLESEVSELTENISESLGLRIQPHSIDNSLFEHDVFGDGEVDDNTAPKRLRTSGEMKPTNPDIPPIEDSENLQSVIGKLARLYALRTTCEDKISACQSEKTLNELAGDDDDIDPLDAFMANTAVDLVGENIAKIQTDLDEINLFIKKFESLEKFLSNDLANSSSLDAAIQQQQRIREKQVEKKLVKETSEQIPRGTGTVWEEEFRKDEDVKERKKIVSQAKSFVPAGPIRLDTSRAGLHVSGETRVSPSAPVPSWQPPDEDDNEAQEKFRKKLGY